MQEIELTEIEKAKLLLEEEHKRLAEECAKEIEEILKKYSFQLQVTPSQIILAPIKG